MITLKKLRTLCKKAGACQEGLDLIKSNSSLEELYEKAPAEFGYWLRREVQYLPEDVKRMAELKACEGPGQSILLRLYIQDIPEDIKRKAELKACESPASACWLRRYVKSLHPDTVEKLKETQ